MRELSFRRIKSEWNETLKTTRLFLLLAQSASNDRRDPRSIQYDRTALWHLSLIPLRESFPEVRANDSPSHLWRRSSSGSAHEKSRRHRPDKNPNPPRPVSEYVFVTHFVEVCEMVKLDHRERFQMQLWILLLKRRKQIGEIAEREFCI